MIINIGYISKLHLLNPKSPRPVITSSVYMELHEYYAGYNVRYFRDNYRRKEYLTKLIKRK